MNGIQYWIIDSYIKAKKPADITGVISPTARQRCGFDDSEEIFSGEDDTDIVYRENDADTRNLLPTIKPNRSWANRKNSLSSANSEYDSELDGDSTSTKLPVDSERSSTYDAVRSGIKPAGKRERLAMGGSTTDSLSSIMLLPGSRGPSTPGYADDAESRRLTLGSARSVGGRSGRSGRSLGDDDSTLVGREEE